MHLFDRKEGGFRPANRYPRGMRMDRGRYAHTAKRGVKRRAGQRRVRDVDKPKRVAGSTRLFMLLRALHLPALEWGSASAADRYVGNDI